MAVKQRSSSVTGITGSGYYTADRMQLVLANGGTWTNTISTDTPDGFADSYKLDCTTADASLGADDLVVFRHVIEAQNLQDFAKGTLSAKSFTVSFYIKTNKTGTYVLELLDDANSRQVSKSYTVSNTNWNRYTITFPADTSGAIANTNAAGLYVTFWLAAGTNWTSGTQQTSWGSITKANRVNGLNVNIADNTSNEWLITGIQLEVDNTGSGVATDFEHRSFGQELALCQRYFNMHADGTALSTIGLCGSNGTYVFPVITFPVTMRAAPSLYLVTGSNYFIIKGGVSIECQVIAANVTSIHTMEIVVTVSTTSGDCYMVRTNNSAARLGFSAEL
tara:strand:- start:203 stop:1207 length:1005 start_codon:yes stop_codon:yes gene_type:complete